jgi:ferredoxin
MKARVIGIGIALLGLGGIASAVIRRVVSGQSFDEFDIVLMAARLVLVVTGIVITLWSFSRSRRSQGWMRLDWFLPAISRRSAGMPDMAIGAIKWLAPTWLSSPVRRVIQFGCLLLFLVLFLHVCWPYSARPSPPGKVSTGWKLDEIDQQNQFRFRRTEPAGWPGEPGGRIYVTEENANDEAESYVASFDLVGVDDHRIVLKPDGTLSLGQLADVSDRFLLSQGPWSLHESEPGVWPSHYADDLERKQVVPAEIFLAVDPLVSLSTSIAARSWIWSLACAGVILIVSLLVPRGFCGYVCPLGTTIDLFDWALAGRVKRFRVGPNGWWVHIKYYLLAGTLICAIFGVLVSGYVSAIPVITRAMMYLGEPIQTGTMRGWHLTVPMNAGHFVSIALFAIILFFGFLKPRFWCKYVCPSGAIFSLGNLLRLTGRKVESTCIHCNKCVENCPFDAIKPDFTTRGTDCTLCQTCGGVCPSHSIKFVERWHSIELKPRNVPPTHETAVGRRGFLSMAVGTAAAVAGGAGMAITTKTFGAGLEKPNAFRPVRPPGSVPEREFLRMCIRCGECLKVCPFNVLQPMGFDQGLEGLWTPLVAADHAGCAPSCNTCGQVCPTGAIRPLPLDEKRFARMGLAVVDEATCLPFANRQACQECVDECKKAGYDAIEFTRVHTEMDEAGKPIEGSGHIAPVVLPDKCVGCGLCQMSCYRVNVKKKSLLERSAIIIEAGEGKEDRLITGSYIELRQEEARQREAEQKHKTGGPGSEYYVPEIPSESSDPLRTLDVPNIDSPPPDEAGTGDPTPSENAEENPFH